MIERTSPSEVPPAGVATGAAWLAARMNSILEPRIRIFAAAEVLTGSPADDVVRLLADLIGAAGDASSGYRTALDAVLVVLSDPGRLSYERRADLYAAASAADLPEVGLILFDVAPAVAGTEKLERQLDSERPLVPTGRPLTLGERKSLARGHRRDLLIQLLRDPHPDVIAILLGNTHLTEADVLKVAARRPMLPAALTCVFRSDRWRARSHVRRALVLNPFTPLPIAARLMTTLPDGDLHGAAADPALGERLREHARRVLARRRRPALSR